MYAQMLRAMAFAVALLCGGVGAVAQTVTQLPVYVDNSGVTDLGNGPTEIRVLSGNLQLFTSSGSGIGSTTGSSTTLVLTSTPLTIPLTGGVISGTGITSGTTVTAFNGGTNITLSAAMTVAASTAVAWGVACPASVGSNRVMLVQAGVGNDLPLYTQARICGAAQNAPGATLLPFAIGAH